MAYVSIEDQPGLQAAIASAVIWHETDNEDAEKYAISFAGDGLSGGSIGGTQCDLSANPTGLAVFIQIMRGGGMPEALLQEILPLVSVPVKRDPLSLRQKQAVDNILSSPPGRQQIDALDKHTLATWYPELDKCQKAADGNEGATIAPDGLIGMALWINASGPPTVMLSWLAGATVRLFGGFVAGIKPGAIVTKADISAYVGHTKQMVVYPKEFPRFGQAVDLGMKSLPASS